MQINQWGEDQLIHYIQKKFLHGDSLVGIGDDCAVIPLDDHTISLVTTDALVEGIHFIKEQITSADLGYKAISVNISDIAAMGGKSKYALLSIALPKNTEADWIKGFLNGVKTACNEYEIDLLGGDTVGSKMDVFINVTLIGVAENGKIKFRHTAQIGDLICLTRCLGDSGAGFQLLQDKISGSEDFQYLISSHVHPIAQPEVGKWLASQKDVHAMMDVSDGLDPDLNRLLRASKCRAEVEITTIPLSESLKKTSLKQGWDPYQFALTGGEDYCLLFTIDPQESFKLNNDYNKRFGTPFYIIGKIVDKVVCNDIKPFLIYTKEGKPFKIEYSTYNHFH